MNGILLGAITSIAIPAIVGVWALFLKPNKTKAFGKMCGKFVTAFGQKKIQRDSYETLESKFQGTASDWFAGFMEGLDSDDK